MADARGCLNSMPFSSHRSHASTSGDPARLSGLLESLAPPTNSDGPVSIGRVWVQVVACDDRGFRYRYAGIEVSRDAFEAALSALGAPSGGADAGAEASLTRG